jgi:hypothetical protein
MYSGKFPVSTSVSISKSGKVFPMHQGKEKKWIQKQGKEEKKMLEW